MMVIKVTDCQNASKTGTMWNTVAARMRSSKTELDALGESYTDLSEGFSKYRDEVMQLSGVDIMKGTGEFKNPYEIMTELAQVWDKINGEPAQARLAEIFAGTRQLSGFMSTIQNISDAMGAYEDATNSAGVATKANDLYMETTAAHVEQLKAAFQELSYDTLNGDLMKGFVDFGKGSLNVIDGIIDKVGTLGTALAAISTATFIKGLSKTSGIKSLADLGTVLTGGVGAFGPIAGITAGVAAIAGIYNAYQKYQENLRNNADNAAGSFFDMEDAIDKSISRASELRSELDSGILTDQQAYEAKKELLDIQNQLADSYPSMSEGLDLLNGSMERNLELTDQMLQGEAAKAIQQNLKAFEESEKIMSSPVDDYFASFYDTGSKYSNQIKDIAKDFSDSILLERGSDVGQFNFRINGDDPRKAYDDLVNFSDKIRKLRDSAENSGAPTTQFDEILAGAETELKILDETLSTYEERAREYQELKMSADDDLYGLPDKEDRRTALQWARDYEKAISDLNEALASGDAEKIADAFSAYENIDKTIKSLLDSTQMGDYSDVFSDLGNQLQSTLLAYNNFERALNGDITAGGTKNVNENAALHAAGEQVKELGLTATEVADMYLDASTRTTRHLTENEAKILDLVHAARRLGIEVTDTSGALTDEFLAALVRGEIATEDFAEEVEDAAFSLETFGEYQSNLKSAMEASLSATGMTEEQIASLSETYKDLEGYDPARLFENTMHGVKLNTEELKRLNEQVEQSQLTELYDKLAQQNLDLYKAKNAGEDISGIQSEIAATEQLIAQYQGMISSYNAWLAARSAGTHRDAWESLGSEYENMAKLAEEGRVGNDALNTYLDTMLGEHRSNTGNKVADVTADLEHLNATVEGTSHSLLDYFSTGDSGYQGLQWFLDDMHTLLGDDFVSLDENGGYAFDFSGEKLDILTDKIKGGREAVELLADALREYGYEVNLGEESYGEQIDNALQKVQSLQDSGELSKDIKLGVDIETAPLDQVRKQIQELRNERTEIDPEINPDGAAALDDLISACEQEYYLRLDVDTEGGLSQAISAVNEINSIISQAQASDSKVSISAVVKGSERVQSLASEIASLPPEVQIAVGVNAMNVGNAEGIVDQLSADPGSITVPINYEPGEIPTTVTNIDGTANYDLGESPTDVPDAHGIANFTLGNSPKAVPPAQGVANFRMGSVPTVLPPAVQFVMRIPIGGKAEGTMTSVGMAMADGTAFNGPWNWHAYAGGNVALPEDEIALVNELGTESIIRNGQWMLLPGGMHTEALKKGDIVLSARQTKALLTSGQALGRGHAYADGTLGSILANAYISGTGPGFKNITVNSSSSASSGSGSGSKSSGNGNNNSNDNSEDDEPEIFDWIELAIDRIERAIKQLGITAKSTFKTLTTRLEANATEIKTVTDEIELQQKAYDRYIQQANSVGLSEDLAERVRNGAIDINEYDKDTQELIDDYQKWYLINALLCSNA